MPTGLLLIRAFDPIFPLLPDRLTLFDNLLEGSPLEVFPHLLEIRYRRFLKHFFK